MINLNRENGILSEMDGICSQLSSDLNKINSLCNGLSNSVDGDLMNTFLSRIDEAGAKISSGISYLEGDISSLRSAARSVYAEEMEEKRRAEARERERLAKLRYSNMRRS